MSLKSLTRLTNLHRNWLQSVKEWRERWSQLDERAVLGRRGEKFAERHLKQQGLLIVDRNFKYANAEIDIVAVEQRTVVFVEVKTRIHADHEAGLAAVDDEKQRRIALAAIGFLRRHHLLENAYRFDIVSVLCSADGKQQQIEHFRNAFEPPAKNQMFG